MKTKELKKQISDQIDQELDYLNEHDQIRKILNKVDKKEFSGRVLNAKILNGFEFVVQYGMFHINGKYNHLIGYKGGKIDAAKFEEFDMCHGGAARGRINQLKNIDFDKLLKAFNKIEKHFNGLRAAFGDLERENLGSFHNPIYYSLLREIQGYKDSSDKIKLSDFYYLRS